MRFPCRWKYDKIRPDILKNAHMQKFTSSRFTSSRCRSDKIGLYNLVESLLFWKCNTNPAQICTNKSAKVCTRKPLGNLWNVFWVSYFSFLASSWIIEVLQWWLAIGRRPKTTVKKRIGGFCSACRGEKVNGWCIMQNRKWKWKWI